jgi:hypothetical protein
LQRVLLSVIMHDSPYAEASFVKIFFPRRLYASEILRKLFERINNINRIHIFCHISFILLYFMIHCF